MSNLHNDNEMQSNCPSLDRLAAVGAEPYWMQDVRLAQRAIEAERLAMHNKPVAQPPSPDQAAS